MVEQHSSHDTPVASLPVYLTRFVGREKEHASLCDLLAARRLLTLVGPGGIGKTRLAVQVASRVASQFPDGLYVVDVSTILTPSLLSYALATMVGIQHDKPLAVLPLLINALGQRHVLVLLDNCEQLLAECASLVETLLQSCPTLHILVTSQEPLSVAGEVVWRVQPLSAPDPAQSLSLECLKEYEAVQLFCERASEHAPRFRLTQSNAPAVVSICSQLDGLPFALELAAALLPTFSVEQIATLLNDRFMLLRQGKRTAPTRQQTLQATLDWSYNLLTLLEQAVLQRLAVFAGTWSLEAAQQVAALPETSEIMIIEVLVRLVNKSLVLAEEQEEAEAGVPELRYRLLETVRIYVQERLQRAGLWELLSEQHAGWYLHLAQQVSEHQQSEEAWRWFDLLERELPNVYAALGRLSSTEQFETAARFADALLRFWITHNHFHEGRYWFERLLALPSAALSPSLRARVLFGASEFARYQGEYERAISLLQEQLTLLEGSGDSRGQAEARNYLGLIMGLRGDYEQGIHLCTLSLDAFQTLGDQSGICGALTSLAFLALAQGQAARAISLCREAIPLLRTMGHRTNLLYALFTLAQAALFQGDKLLAQQTCREALSLSQELRNHYGIAASLGLIGGLASLAEHPLQAARLFGAAQALQARIRTPHPAAGRALLERMVISLIASVGADTFRSQFAAGQQAPLQQSIQEAEAILQLSSPSSQAEVTSSSSSLSPSLSALSQREREILTLVATGMTDAQIADTLVISPRTVGKHLQSIYAKLHVNSRSAATRLALEGGLV